MIIKSSKVIEIANNEVGYLEKRSNSNLDSKTANAGSGNYTKYWRDLAPGMNGQAWCNCFVNWCFVQAYGVETAKKLLCTDGGWSYYTPASASYFKNKGQWYSSPKIGDIIYFKNSQRICHVGIVYAVDESRVYTIEGNTSAASGVVANGGGVAKKSYVLGYNRIAGYGRPKYDKTDKVSITSNSNSNILKLGVKGDSVKTLQQNLNIVMKSGLIVDGDFGDKTKTALINFQKKYGLEADGEYGSKSKAKMTEVLKTINNSNKTKTVKKETNPYKEPITLVKKGMKNESVKWVQWELNQKGAELTIDGDFGTKTFNAVKNYQKQYKLEVDGIVGNKTKNSMKKD